ncbi:uncharacterized protein LOC126204301 [Schistocerca nitens]|uniref:uncharacterized protein LOC126204301 n=1 Tax=Schistocerca nitens TaxID=7011 RepID=UPI00211886C2|nr:uncharacterized protein LOC126204301 [Schistocerca nitens]
MQGDCRKVMFLSKSSNRTWLVLGWVIIHVCQVALESKVHTAIVSPTEDLFDWEVAAQVMKTDNGWESGVLTTCPAPPYPHPSAEEDMAVGFPLENNKERREETPEKKKETKKKRWYGTVMLCS